MIVSMRKGVSDRRQIAVALAAACVGGHQSISPRYMGRPVACSNCPPIRSQRRRFWPKTSGVVHEGSLVPVASGILGSGKDLASGDSVYTSRLSGQIAAAFPDHVIYGMVVVPGRRMPRWRWLRVGSPAPGKVFFYEPIILPEKELSRTQPTVIRWTGMVSPGAQPPYGERGVEWSLNADGTAVSGVDIEPVSDKTDPDIEKTIGRLDRMRPQDLFETFT